MSVFEDVREVRIEGLTRRFEGRAVLDQLQLQVPPGQFVALLGRSGSGKSTLLRALAGLDDDVAKEGVLQVPPARSVLFQDSRLLPWESVLANVILGIEGESAEQQGRKALASVGLAGRESAWPNQLSGGEQQRAALARSLVRRPQLLLADEPFGALDALTRLKMQALLRSVVQRERPTVLAGHPRCRRSLGSRRSHPGTGPGTHHARCPSRASVTLGRTACFYPLAPAAAAKPWRR